MRIPINPATGLPTVSVSSLRLYGAGAFSLDDQEADKGCPRLWKARYIDRDPATRDVESAPLQYGTFFHEVMHTIETKDITPDAAVLECFQPHYPAAFISEIKDDLENYFSREDSDALAILETEVELSALLYVDEEFGPIYIRGFIDVLAVDPDMPGVIHVKDFKTNRTPPSDSSVAGDVQLKCYHWLVQQNAARFMDPRQIVCHFDAVKWRDVQVTYSDRDIEDWHDWAVAVVRAIVRDNDAEPRVNPGCGFCPIRQSCPAFQELPQAAAILMESIPGDGDTDEALLEWRDKANGVRLILEKGVKAIDETVKRRAVAQGGLVIGQQQWTPETAWRNAVDVEALHRLIGEDVWGLAKVGKGDLETYAARLDPSKAEQVLGTLTREPSGVTVKRKKLDAA